MKLAVIGAGYMAKVIIERAKSLGVETHCFAWENGATAKEACDYFYPISVFDKDEILEKCKEIKVDGVVAAASVSIKTAAFIAETLKLHGNPIEVAERIGDKFVNREKTKNIKELTQIKYGKVRTLEEFEDLELSYPIILKPTNSGGKDGISVVYRKEELETAFQYSMEGHDELIVEEYISGGQEYSVESLSYEGKHYIIQITEKVSSGPPHCVELAHHQPANLSDEMKHKIDEVMKNVLHGVGIENGPCHSEIKVVDEKVYLIEINGRLGGDHISYPLTELSSGYPYITGVIQAALGILEPIELDGQKGGYASVYFITQQTKHLKEIFDVCENEEWCYKYNKVSDELINLEKNNGFRINHFIYYSKNKKPWF